MSCSVVAASNGAAGIQSNQSGGGDRDRDRRQSTVYGNNIGIQSVGGGGLLSYLEYPSHRQHHQRQLHRYRQFAVSVSSRLTVCRQAASG